MNYTKIPADTFKNIQLNAGILVSAFVPATGTISGELIGATSGGVNFVVTPEFVDFGEDIDSCPKNTKELKKQNSIEAKMSGTFVTVTAALAKRLVAAGDIDSLDATHIVPRKDLADEDFTDLWWIGDYSDVNDGENAGFIAIHMLNTLSTAGFQIQSTDKAKGTFPFEFTAHFSMNAQDTVPYEIYVKQGNEVKLPGVEFGKHALSLTVPNAVNVPVRVYPADAEITFDSDDATIAAISEGAAGFATIGAASTGSVIVRASITVDGVDYEDTCTVICS